MTPERLDEIRRGQMSDFSANPAMWIKEEDLLAHRDELLTYVDELKAVVDRQAEDDGLWFTAQTAPEAYLQQELRKLHAEIEGEPVRLDPADFPEPEVTENDGICM